MEAGRREHDTFPTRWVVRTSAPARGGYAASVSCVEAFRRGEDPSTEGLRPVRGDFGSYVEARLLERLSTAFAERVRQWQACRRGLEDEHIAGMPSQRRVDPSARQPLVGGVRPGRIPGAGARRN